MPGSVAARTMGWQHRMGGIAGPLSASGEASNGEPVQVEMYVSGSWVDITGYVMVRDSSGNISITRGRRDEGGSADHAVMQLLLDNRDGRFSPRNPTGAYYGLIGRNTPIRLSVPNGTGGKSYRFWGEVTAWPVGWDSTGTDVYVELEASGVIRRLSQAPPPSHSVIYNAIVDPNITGLVAYWPCEDASTATRIESALTSGSPMTFTGDPVLAAYEGFGASDPLPTLTDAALTGGIAFYDVTNVTQYQLRYLLAVPEVGFSDLDVISRMQVQEVAAGVSLLNYFDIHFDDPPGGLGSYGAPGALTLLARDGDQAQIGTAASLSMDVRGRRLRVSLENSISGTTLTATLRVLDVESGDTDSASLTLVSTSISRVKSVSMAPSTIAGAEGVDQMAAGHVTVQTTITAIDDLGRALQPNGEGAGRRIQRLCGEEGIAFDAIGDLDDSVALGGQSRLNTLELIREAELADGGMLYENLAVLGLGYRTRVALLNQDAQLTLDYAGYNLSEIPQPVEDDRYIQNKVTVTVGEVSQTYEMTEGTLSTELPPAGVGIYGDDVTLNLEDSDEALSHAAWRVHLGTVDEPRYPQISVNLAHSSFTSNPALKLAVLGLRPGDRILVQNPPSWLPPGDIDQILLGFEETITRFEHRITFVCAPASPYNNAGVLDDTLAIIDTDGSELLAAVSSSDTSLTVGPSNSIFTRWTTDSSNMPFDIRVGGEVMRVTGIANYVTDTFTRTTADGWGTADSGQSWTNVNAADSDFSTNGSEARHSVGSVNSSRYSVLTAVSADVDVQVDMATSALATGGPHYSHIVARYVNTNNMYTARLRFNTDQTIDLAIQRRRNGTQTDIEQVAISGTHAASTFFTVRFQIVGTVLRAKAWETGTVEPDWIIVTEDGTFTAPGFIGTRSVLDTANTNPLPVTFSYDNYQIINPQTFTVTRSVNGVQKAQVAGEDVRLAYPTIISL